MLIEIRLYATLRHYAPAHAVAGVFSTNLPDASTVKDLLESIGLPAGEVHIRMVNGASADLTKELSEGDRIGLFPAVGGG